MGVLDEEVVFKKITLWQKDSNVYYFSESRYILMADFRLIGRVFFNFWDQINFFIDFMVHQPRCLVEKDAMYNK